ncbi:ribonuclease P protein component [Actinocorallia aurantiaca]|uniref:Ribonuclease P protein component n=1 Tax=Actinocorallia aurantiaca TaxID=46204 RepID=A0ABP6G9B4_9ACTN
MLPSGHRMRRRQEFTLAVRRGDRAGRPHLVAHLLPEGNEGGNSLAGFIVSKAVGNSVVRGRVQRRLRHLVRDRLALLPPGSLLVVRANPKAASASSEELARDLDSVLGRLLKQSGKGQ